MATLTKSQPVPSDDSLISLSSSIPAPFSSADRAYVLRSSHSDGLPNLITPTRAAYEHPGRTEEDHISEETPLITDGETSATAIQVSNSLGLRPGLTRYTRIKMSCLQ